MNLEASVRSGDLAAALDVLRAGADVNRRSPEGFTPLMIAAGLGHVQMVDLLLTAGGDTVAVEPRTGAAPLHKAAQSGDPGVLCLLLDHGAFIDQQGALIGHTALMDAVVHKQERAVRLLLERGARTTIRNHAQQTALDLAREEGLGRIIRLIETSDEARHERARGNVVVAAARAGDAGEVERLIGAGASVDERVPMMGSVDDDTTPLGLAAREGRLDVVRVLLAAGADPRVVIEGMKGTALHQASYFGHADIVRAMTERPHGPTAPAPLLDAQGPYNGFTALHDAVWHGRMEAARALVEAGARLDLKTHADLTARDLASLYGYDDLAAYLAQAEQA